MSHTFCWRAHGRRWVLHAICISTAVVRVSECEATFVAISSHTGEGFGCSHSGLNPCRLSLLALAGWRVDDWQ